MNSFKFLNQICPKMAFAFKDKEVNINIGFYIFELVYAPNFTIMKKIWILRPSLVRMSIFSQKQKIENHHWILHIRIVPCTKFHFKETTLNSGRNLPKIGISNQKQKKGNTTMKFFYSNYFRYKIWASTDKFSFFEQICPERVFLVENRKTVNHRWILHD